eukprot:scaffold91726_cov59-Attheya_sp.AAC.3
MGVVVFSHSGVVVEETNVDVLQRRSHGKIEGICTELTRCHIFDRAMVAADFTNDTDRDRFLLFDYWILLAIASVLPR